MGLSGSSLRKTSDFWSSQESWQVGRGIHWLELRAVQNRLNQKISGAPNIDWVQHTLQSYLSDRLPVERCLSLGCGEGELERRLASNGAFRQCDAYDVASGSIAVAREAAAAAGFGHIHYEIVDVNQVTLAPEFYDVVWVNGAMHHFERLEHIVSQLAQSLRTGGLLVLNEYVGPSRFQFPTRQKEVIRAALNLLPTGHRRWIPAQGASRPELTLHPGRIAWFTTRLVEKISEGSLLPALRRRFLRTTCSTQIKTEIVFPTPRDVLAGDPSEAVRSADILSALAQHFVTLEYKQLGGTVLQFLLEGIAGNFDDGKPESALLLDLMFRIEDALIACGDLNSDFVYLVAKPTGAR